MNHKIVVLKAGLQKLASPAYGSYLTIAGAHHLQWMRKPTISLDFQISCKIIPTDYLKTLVKISSDFDLLV